MKQTTKEMKKIALFLLFFSLVYLGVKTHGFQKDKVLVLGMIYGGKIVSPEGSQILDHYCFGDGDTLFLDPEYIKKSPVILKNIQGLKNGQRRKIRFHQKEDWRLSYALNPFFIEKRGEGYRIYQYIAFDKKGKDYTYLDLKVGKIKVQDGIVHTYECKPFVAVCDFTL